MMLETAKRAIHDHAMIPSGGRVLVAVSGGLDSVVLLDVLHRLSTELSFTIVVGHVDHGLRGDASNRDSDFVQGLATDYGLTSVQYRLSEFDLNQHRTQGREGAARHARLAALEALAGQVGATRIGLGHTLDDHAETILYRLVRGAGPTGMQGIPPLRLPFIRPLIQALRSDVHAYAVERKLDWREDETNSDVTYARNRIRHRVLPELRELNPRIVEVLGRNADLLADLDEAVAFFVNERIPHLRIGSNDSDLSLSRNKLASLPDPVLRLVLREGIRQARGNLIGIELTHIEAVRQLTTSQRTHGELSLPELHVRMQSDALAFIPAPHASNLPWEMAVDLGETQLPHGDLALELKIVPIADVDMESVRSDRWIEAVDADCVTLPLRLRTRGPGDRFTPLGMGQEIKLKDLLINEHTPYFDRDGIPLLCDSDAIVWVVGIRLSDTVKLTERTQRVLLMRMKGVR